MKKNEQNQNILEKNPFTRLIKVIYTFGLIFTVLVGFGVSYSMSQKPTDGYKDCSTYLSKPEYEFKGFGKKDEVILPQGISPAKVQEFKSLRSQGYEEGQVVSYISCNEHNAEIFYETDIIAFILFSTISSFLVSACHLIIKRTFFYVTLG